MPVVVVQAHPVPDSLNAALLDRVVAGLRSAGTPHRVHRLCQGERPAPDALSDADELVLVYPTWWGGQPASLLEWIQDMLAADAFGAVRRVVAVTSLGSSQLLNTVQGEWGRSHLATLVLQACAADATFEWLPLYKVDRQSQPAIDAHLGRVEDRFAGRRRGRVARPMWQRTYGRRPPAPI